MGELIGTQSNINHFTLFALGTAPFLSPINQHGNLRMVPSQNYNIFLNETEFAQISEYDYQYKLPDYLLGDFQQEQNLIEMDIIGKIKIKIKKTVPLKFESVENNDGFIS